MRAICPRCPGRRQDRHLRPIARTLLDHDGGAVFATFTLQSERTLADAVNALTRTRGLFTANRWLTGRAARWTRSTEVTYDPGTGWHAHDHWLVLTDGNQESTAIGDAMRVRWLDAARRAGCTAHEHGQRIEHPRRLLDTAKYASKGLFASHGAGGGTSLQDILDGAMAGDADAYALWHEVEGYAVENRHKFLEPSRGFSK